MKQDSKADKTPQPYGKRYFVITFIDVKWVTRVKGQWSETFCDSWAVVYLWL